LVRVDRNKTKLVVILFVLGKKNSGSSGQRGSAVAGGGGGRQWSSDVVVGGQTWLEAVVGNGIIDQWKRRKVTAMKAV